jgi:hypothetical protein
MRHRDVQAHRTLKVDDRTVKVSQLIKHPTQAINDVAIARAQINCTFKHPARTIEIEALFNPRVAKIV